MTVTSPLAATAIAAAALVGGAVLPATAVADQVADSPVPNSTAQLTMQEENQQEADVTTLTCEPSGGTHPQADDACGALIDADGDFTRLPVQSRACTLQYAPVTVHASGTWRGEPVDFQHTYANRCAAASETGGVFSF